MRNFIFILVLLWSSSVHAEVINIVAAENFYGELAREIGGKQVNVSSIISNPDADPHLFTTTPTTSIAISQAKIIIYNGDGYDQWMEQITQTQKNLAIIKVADLMQANKANTNPHLWYNPATMPTLALHLANLLIQLDSMHKEYYLHNLKIFLAHNQTVQNKISSLKSRVINTPVTATEPIFNYMTDALGLNMQGLEVQSKIMNNTEPAPKMLANYLDLLNKHKVKILFYNSQVTDNTTKNILSLAQKNNIPVVGITETMPLKSTVNDWLMDQLQKTEAALTAVKK